MTTTSKDITNFLEEKGISFNPIRMDWLLGKLTHEELEDFLYLLEEANDSSDAWDRGYSEGHAEGYDDGFVAGVDSTSD